MLIKISCKPFTFVSKRRSPIPSVFVSVSLLLNQEPQPVVSFRTPLYTQGLFLFPFFLFFFLPLDPLSGLPTALQTLISEVYSSDLLFQESSLLFY